MRKQAFLDKISKELREKEKLNLVKKKSVISNAEELIKVEELDQQSYNVKNT